MELDTGAAISLISQEMMHELFPGIQLKPCDIVLWYTIETDLHVSENTSFRQV